MILTSLVFLSACGLVPAVDGVPSDGIAAPAGEQRPQARPDDAPVDNGLDTPDEVADGPADPEVTPAPASGALGSTIASLGNAAEPGLWLKTPLVQREQPGRVTYPDSGQSVAVTLIPIDGPATAGSRLSLAAMQAIGAPLTGLPEITVTAG